MTKSPGPLQEGDAYICSGASPAGMKLAHLFPLFRAQNSEQGDLGFHHRVNGFGFQAAHFIGQGPQTRFIQFAGMHHPVHFQ